MSGRLEFSPVATTTTTATTTTSGGSGGTLAAAEAAAAAISTCSQPRSILKKPITPTSPKVITFYSGNEINKSPFLLNGDTNHNNNNNNNNNCIRNHNNNNSNTNDNNNEDDDASSLIYNTEKRITMHPHKKTAANASRVKLHEIELRHRIRGQPDDDEEEEEEEVYDTSDGTNVKPVTSTSTTTTTATTAGEREDKLRRDTSPHTRCLTNGKYLKQSALTAHWLNPVNHHRGRRKPSSAYILNNKQIDAEVFNCFRDSICNFIDEFKRKSNVSECEDARLLDRANLVIRSLFLEQLREYLFYDEYESSISSCSSSSSMPPVWEMETGATTGTGATTATTKTVASPQSSSSSSASSSAFSSPSSTSTEAQAAAAGQQPRKSFALELGVSLSDPGFTTWRRGSTVIDDSSAASKTKIPCSQSSIAIDHDRLKRFDFTSDSKKGVYRITAAAIPDEMVCGSLPVNSTIEMHMRAMRRSPPDRRCSQLTHEMRKSSSGSLHGSGKCIVSTATANKKAVRFADAFGLDLTSVRVITNSSFMFASSSDLDKLETTTSGFSATNTPSAEMAATGSSMFNAISAPFLVLIPLFSIRRPLNNDYIVKLDEYLFDYENKIVKCIAKVKNLSYEKKVYARITFNGWRTSFDLDAMYLRPDSAQPNMFDSFGFCIIIPDKSTLVSSSSLYGITPSTSIGGLSISGGVGGGGITSSGASSSSSKMDDCFCRIEFALCTRQNSLDYWDNNGGDNYKFQCFYNITS